MYAAQDNPTYIIMFGRVLKSISDVCLACSNYVFRRLLIDMIGAWVGR